ncbi:transcription factor TFIIIB component B'' [Acrasis kona]|uniref:Transcription factor TFIIIB component B n=1 Tax=Acrasis kona TaxID=1008807 RepID=A0AAW2YZE6_9EUKA
MNVWHATQHEKAALLSKQLTKLLGEKGKDVFPTLLKVLCNEAPDENSTSVSTDALLENVEGLIKGINDRTRYYKRLEEENVQLKLMLNTTLNIINTFTIPELKAKHKQQLMVQSPNLNTKKILNVRERKDVPSFEITQPEEESEEEIEEEDEDDDTESLSDQESEYDSSEYDNESSIQSTYSEDVSVQYPNNGGASNEFSCFQFPAQQPVRTQQLRPQGPDSFVQLRKPSTDRSNIDNGNIRIY